jgi:signal peptidase I
MKPYDIYVFFLCLVVFTALTIVFTYLIYEIIKLTVKVIRHGVDDENIVSEYHKEKTTVKKKTFSVIFSFVLCGFLMVFFIFSLWLHFSEDVFTNSSSLKVVASSSMASQHKKNTYLFENNLDNQLNTFDLIVTRPVPDEFELELYDIVVYQYEDIFVIHRIVGIEEPNSEHPDHRLFITQGDAISSPDREPVTYEQIKAVYENEKVPFVGSFVFFMKSPAGWLCVLLVLYAIIATPIVEKKIKKTTYIRLYEIGIIDKKELAKNGVDVSSIEIMKIDRKRKE